MSYYAITGNQKIIITKTCETIKIGKCKVSCFFELEFKPNMGGTHDDIVINLYLPGKIKYNEVSSVINSNGFYNWYYSQKNIELKSKSKITLNNDNVKILTPIYENIFDKNNQITNLSLKIDKKNIETNIDRYVIFFEYFGTKQTSQNGGQIFFESRYFDKKYCPDGMFLEKQILEGNILEVQSIYCWCLLPFGYFLNNFTSFNNFEPRDVRRIEDKFYKFFKLSLLEKKNKFIYGNQQVINWKISSDQITFFNSYQNDNKWDEIRLFLNCEYFPLKRGVAILSVLFTILGFLVGLISIA